MRSSMPFVAFLLSSIALSWASGADREVVRAPAPLFRDPLFDGAADPTVVWNAERKEWWLFYTQRRANRDEPGVRWCHGTDIGIAVSTDMGRTWAYRGPARGLEVRADRDTFWAPEVIRRDGLYHMFVSFIPGVHDDWSGERHIHRYTSADLLDWRFEGRIPLSSSRVIDPCVFRFPDGTWRLWWKDEAHGSHIYGAESRDLAEWTGVRPVIEDRGGEAPNVFFLGGTYWMLTDSGALNLYRSADGKTWTHVGPFLREPGKRPDDGQAGKHADVVVQGDHGFVFYFVHPEGRRHVAPGKHRSSLQVARLEVRDGMLVAIRDEPFDFDLRPPDGDDLHLHGGDKAPAGVAPAGARRDVGSE